MEKRKSVPFFTKVPFSFFKAAAIGQRSKLASLKAHSNPAPVKENRVPKNITVTRRIREKATTLPTSIPATDIQASFGSKGQLVDSSMNELDLIDEQ